MKNKKMSKRTLALIASALILLGAGGVMGTSALPNIVSDDYQAEISLDQLTVDLNENGTAVGGTDEEPGTLLAETLKDTDVEPGKTYKEVITAKNTSEATPEYVRIVVRKYWTKDGKKATDLSPDLIQLKSDKDAYNDADWIKVDGTDEMTTYYYKKALAEGEETSALFNKLRIDDSILAEMTESEPEEIGNKKVYKYTYKYDGYSFNIEAEAQAVQTHSAEQAIKSIWGVDATVSDGTIEKVE